MDPNIKQVKILYVSAQTQSDKFTFCGNVITWRGGKNRAYNDRTGISKQIMMIERGLTDTKLECRVILDWPDIPIHDDGTCTHHITFGDVIAVYPDALHWFMNYVGVKNGKFRPNWGFNMFDTDIAALAGNDMIPSKAYHPLQNKLFKITGDRGVNRCYIRFMFYNRGPDVCSVEPCTSIDEEDEFGIYGDCDDLAAFVYRLDCAHGHTYNGAEDDYRLTPVDVMELVTDSKVAIKPCANKTEKKLEEIMRGWGWKVEPQFTAQWARRTRNLRYDFRVEVGGPKFIVELDGRQHFEDVAHFRTVASVVQAQDHHKATLALERDLAVVRVHQESVWKDTYDWQTDLKNRVAALSDVAVYYVPDTEIYDAHRALFTV